MLNKKRGIPEKNLTEYSVKQRLFWLRQFFKILRLIITKSFNVMYVCSPNVQYSLPENVCRYFFP